MIIIALTMSALCLYAGFLWGKQNGRTELERKIIRYVIDSPDYGNQVVDAIRKSLSKVKE